MTDCTPEGLATLSLRNKFAAGDTVEVVGPDTKPFTMTAPMMADADGLPLAEPKTPQMVFTMQLFRNGITNSRACPSAAVCYVWGRKIPMEKMGSRRCQVFLAAKEVNHSRSRLQIRTGDGSPWTR